jgi:uncharacterized protein YndB with AHSA1/START domain
MRRRSQRTTAVESDPMTDEPGLAVRDVSITRLVKSRRELVWRLWTEADHLAQWWGPHGFTNPECSIDPRPGGELRIVMRSPDGEQYLNVGIVQAVDPPTRLVFTIALVNSDGSRRLENLTTVDLTENDEGTEVAVHVKVLYAAPEADQNLAGMEDGWNESLEELAQTAVGEKWQT